VGVDAGVLSAPGRLAALRQVGLGPAADPGMVGLAEPWATTRQTPLSHSMCQHVTAYAGMPLTDGQGHVLGSLCAIDTRPRSWSALELTDLADLAEACGADLRLRIVSRQAHVALERSKLTLRA
jgi:GAF domain-containing protein